MYKLYPAGYIVICHDPTPQASSHVEHLLSVLHPRGLLLPLSVNNPTRKENSLYGFDLNEPWSSGFSVELLVPPPSSI